MIIPRAIERASRLYSQSIACVCGEIRLTYAEIKERINRLSRAFADFGIGKGDRIALLMLNCHRFFETAYACAQLGIVLVPLNYRLTPAELSYIVNDSDSKLLLIDDAMIGLLADLKPQLTTVERYILAGTDGAPDGVDNYEELIARSSGSCAQANVTEDDLAGLFYTSGTTGVPKGVMLTHKNLMMNAYHTLMATSHNSAESYLHVAPMFHLADFPTIITITQYGGTHIIIKKFDPQLVLETIERERVSYTLLVPTMINFVIRHPGAEKYDLSSLKQIIYGASPIPVEVLKQAMKLFGCKFIQGYGLSEASPLLTVLSAEDHVTEGSEKQLRRLTSCGREIVGVEVRVVNESGNEVKPGEVGEIIARGPNIMQGYWKKPEETARAIRGGWLYTGDMAIVDEENYIYLVDRKKDMIVTGGENVYSTEVENALYTHPAIKEAAVIGVPDERWGEAVKAVVVLKPDISATEAEIIAHCQKWLANYKVPKSVDIIEGELPKSGAGKILKRELREKYWKGHQRRIN